MARRPRSARGGLVYHVINRGNCKMNLFEKDGDFSAFLKVLEEGRRRHGMRLLGYCLMSNHWHLVLWPRGDKDLSQFMQWVSTTHVRRWREHRSNVGEGHLYQGRFKSFPIEQDHHLLTVLRYVEANPLRATLVRRAEEWPWSSLGRGLSSPDTFVQLSPWPVERAANWTEKVNASLTQKEVEQIRLSVRRGRPFGRPSWVEKTAKTLGLQSSLRDPWRPNKAGAQIPPKGS
jgi:putative transposase